MFNDRTTPATHLTTRRSSRPRNLVAPGPDDAALRTIVETACRTPDHGKLSPWRVVHVASERRERLGEALVEAYRAANPQAGRLEQQAMRDMAHWAPTLLVVLSSPDRSSKIPVWEQELSCGAFAMNLLHAAHATGFVGGWITGWPAYEPRVRDLFGSADERIAGFIYLGTPDEPLEERARPSLADVLSEWEA